MYQFDRREPGRIAALLATFTSATVVIMILVFLAIDSYPVFANRGMGFLVGDEWDSSKEVYGVLPMIYGSATITLLAMLISLPLALGSAVYISECLSERWRAWVKGCMELLAGIPSIVYGLIGIAILNELVKTAFMLNDGSTILSAAILLSVMVLPTIMTFSEDAIHHVPGEYREASLGLGLSRMETVIRTVLPMATPGILGATLLGIGRAMGETMAVMLVVGCVDRIPIPIYNILSPSQTMTSKLGREAAEALGVGLQWNALVGLGLVLFVMVIGITLISETLSTRWRKVWTPEG